MNFKNVIGIDISKNTISNIQTLVIIGDGWHPTFETVCKSKDCIIQETRVKIIVNVFAYNTDFLYNLV